MIISKIMLADSKRVLTDPFMLFMYFAPWLTALGAKFFWEYSQTEYPSWPMEDYRLLISLSVCLMVSLNMGIVLGFQLLEEKEQGLFKAIAVTPLNHNRYLLYRFSLLIVISMLLAYASHFLLQLYTLPAIELFLILVLAAMQVPIQALVISSIASNTMEGFAAMKATGFLLLLPLLVLQFFNDSPLNWIAAVLPYFWVIKAYQYSVLNEKTLFFITFFGGIAYQIIITSLLYKIYRKHASN